MKDITELAETDKISSKYGDEASPSPNNHSGDGISEETNSGQTDSQNLTSGQKDVGQRDVRGAEGVIDMLNSDCVLGDACRQLVQELNS
jgi:hypothetical protein